ncbi:MAG TPA: prepilin-type N-terminal cleavage/methylation domain-containing protein [Kiritimatiellia bacterium]|nr:prepilin-type N-terminal cleavage/methylation domain-containing protein [Kiritimatiellia bacterium]HPS06335.1 prepilin-type N-terminal cleavage/methylation domain-containing protein [Kiritimatiellia bacterium]
MNGRAGFTMIEILIATMILSLGLMTLMVSLTNCAAMMTLSKEYQDAQYVFSLGELKYPIVESTDVEEELPVEPVNGDELLETADRKTLEMLEAYTFERTVDEKELESNEVDDNLYVVRTKVSWGPGEDQQEELVRYVRQLKGESDKKK